MQDASGTAVFATTFECAHIFNGPTGVGDGKAAFAVGYDDGRLDIHLMHKRHLEAGGNELNFLSMLVEAPKKLAKVAKVVMLTKFEGDEDLA